MISDAEKEVFKYLQDPEFSNNAVIKVWREAFQKFKTKKGARSSIEALLKRVYNGNHIGTINPLVPHSLGRQERTQRSRMPVAADVNHFHTVSRRVGQGECRTHHHGEG